jgi:hypothetical protein
MKADALTQIEREGVQAMNRAGVLSIVLAAAVTGACGGADSASSSPTGPSSTSTTTSSQPQPGSQQASCVPQNLSVASMTGSTVTLQWNAVNGATEYSVLVGSTPSSSDLLSTNTSNNNYTWTAKPGRQYARVQAKCGGAFGGSSNEVEFTVAGSSAD